MLYLGVLWDETEWWWLHLYPPEPLETLDEQRRSGDVHRQGEFCDDSSKTSWRHSIRSTLPTSAVPVRLWILFSLDTRFRGRFRDVNCYKIHSWHSFCCFSLFFVSSPRPQVATVDRFSRSIHQTARFHARKYLLGYTAWLLWEQFCWWVKLCNCNWNCYCCNSNNLCVSFV